MTFKPALVPVILCGGLGMRLWPLSRHDHPKQFHALGGQRSLLQQTALRLANRPDGLAQPVLVVANEEHRFIAGQQLAELGLARGPLILEPQGRDTAPALTLAALALERAGQGHTPMLVSPADHHIADEVAFWATVNAGTDEAAAGAVVLFGVAASRPQTGYGYIHAGVDRGGGSCPVRGFVEKPDAERVRGLWRSNDHYWNSGLFLLRADIWLGLLGQHRPDILQACRDAMQGARDDGDFLRPGAEAFRRCPPRSIDHAVIEPLAAEAPAGARLSMRVLSAGWSDLGAWDEVLERLPRDARGNAAVGASVAVDCTDTLLMSGGRLLGAVGLRGVVVVETADAVLVVDRSKTQAVKSLVQALKDASQDQALRSQTAVQRPWGWFDVVGRGPGWLTKHITVRPGASLSLQRHRHRAEHWVVVCGVADVWRDGSHFRLGPDSSTFIAPGQMHKLANLGEEPLEILEVQTGALLTEDDIARLDDRYGRAGPQTG
ncbi:MAG: mannose-1-phosphate guanylyltransferase/mannose-6-phosphate isomerase [Proteobacteria bacterium]|nr:mannose-1-phosphate guanylyltransferase/mannose-6-phosphate isomerase [Burkholderiales bacterium]MCA0309336.1 mannose-1-phosphate guanylyltransferase/mannose-6-phosphate isomerase [Pseudomonadota bacterium]